MVLCEFFLIPFGLECAVYIERREGENRREIGLGKEKT